MTPLLCSPENWITVTPEPGYNSWSFIRPLGSRLVCMYSRGTEHTVDEPVRGVFSRISDDGGKSWSPEYTVVNSPDGGEIAEGSGLDADGNLLLFVRFTGSYAAHRLYRSRDGISFELLADLRPDPMPMQLMDIFHPRSGGLMTLWFAGNYRLGTGCTWGTFFSGDNGRTWQQRVLEKDLPRNLWPTEPSAAVLEDGRIIAIARCEVKEPGVTPRQFQLESADNGISWKKYLTDITDVRESTPALLYDRERQLLTNYYYHRNLGLLKRRTARLPEIWGHPEKWSDWTAVTSASTDDYHAGNVKACSFNGQHAVTVYSGNERQTAVLSLLLMPPEK